MTNSFVSNMYIFIIYLFFLRINFCNYKDIGSKIKKNACRVNYGTPCMKNILAPITKKLIPFQSIYSNFNTNAIKNKTLQKLKYYKVNIIFKSQH